MAHLDLRVDRVHALLRRRARRALGDVVLARAHGRLPVPAVELLVPLRLVLLSPHGQLSSEATVSCRGNSGVERRLTWK